jgi:hypothetical protein
MRVIYQLIYLVCQTLYFFIIAVPIAIILFIILQIVDFVKKRARKINRWAQDKQLNK